MDYGQNPMQTNIPSNSPVGTGFDPTANANPWHTVDNPAEGQLTIPDQNPGLETVQTPNTPGQAVQAQQITPESAQNIGNAAMNAPAMPEQPAMNALTAQERPAFQIVEVDQAPVAQPVAQSNAAEAQSVTSVKHIVIEDNLRNPEEITSQIDSFKSGKLTPNQLNKIARSQFLADAVGHEVGK